MSSETSSCALDTSLSANGNQLETTAVKKKRNLPGNPDPEAEVIALSPRTLLATNRFVCEICNKGFQRDQNLQLHRRGHNLPWKLRQRSSKDIVRKRVYICPELSCVHHNPSRALGDLTGIKKHFCRKHGEKKWKCDKCSKKYAVQSDWKAHLKTCGSREYRCDCGTLFSRRDSFITHRAFCDALAEESAKVSKRPAETAPSNANPNMPLWLHTPPPPPPPPPCMAAAMSLTESAPLSLSASSRLMHMNMHMQMDSLPGLPFLYGSGNGNGNVCQMSATALLQKAAEMGSTMADSSAVKSSRAQNSSMLCMTDQQVLRSNGNGNGNGEGFTRERDFLGMNGLGIHNLNLSFVSGVCGGQSSFVSALVRERDNQNHDHRNENKAL
eukprot:TRINITY_DN330_c1_g3_i1.p1 TRINITY_DN330_c1_g3~~TRINITY_DN330_c1_g3_i1.p1  ORF type:complete len:384 (-),score=20.80 TRINITY_DN330_c1_g3_i1:467-1618(-)